MALNYLIDLGHNAKGLADDHKDFLIVADILVRECSAPSVMKPLMTHLETADLKFPHLFRNAVKAALTRSRRTIMLSVSGFGHRFGGIQPDRIIRPTHALDKWISGTKIFRWGGGNRDGESREDVKPAICDRLSPVRKNCRYP